MIEHEGTLMRLTHLTGNQTKSDNIEQLKETLTNPRKPTHERNSKEIKDSHEKERTSYDIKEHQHKQTICQRTSHEIIEQQKTHRTLTNQIQFNNVKSNA